MVRIISAYHTAIDQVNTTAESLGALSLQVLCRLLHPKSKHTLWISWKYAYM